MFERRRFKQTVSFRERLLEEASRLRREADHATSESERALLLKKARSAEIASEIQRWITSPGLQPPK